MSFYNSHTRFYKLKCIFVVSSMHKVYSFVKREDGVFYDYKMFEEVVYC